MGSSIQFIQNLVQVVEQSECAAVFYLMGLLI